MIEIRHLNVRLGNFLISDINLTINDNEYFVILGPTGAGKTILLECIAGLHKIKHGEVWMDGKELTHLTPEERHIGYVPQDYVLFPFLNVKENIVFGLTNNKYSKNEKQERLINLANLLNIANLLERDVRSLSGGEKQRVAIARALAPNPQILLLDEPLSSLDMRTAKHLRLELKKMHRVLGVTTVHITHNQDEAEELADRIAIINNGKIEQTGTPGEIFFSPKNETVSDFIGAANILTCDSYHSLGSGLAEVDCGGMRIILPHDDGKVQKIAILPRDVWVSDESPPGYQVNRFKGKVINIEHTGIIVRLNIEVEKHSIKADVQEDIFEEMKLEPGSDAYLILRLRSLKTLG